MNQNLKKHACSKCNFSTSRKFNLQRHFKRKHQNQYHEPVQAHQALIQQQGGKVQVLHQQHDQNNGQVNTQSEYRYIKLLDLALLKTRGNIEYLLQNVDHFLGCFPLDSLPSFPTSFPKSMIINTQPSSHPGEHWVSLVLTETECYYFDSFALPTVPLNIDMYLQPHYKEIKYLDYRIQGSTSIYCGAYCVSFVLHVHDYPTYDQFIGHYHSDNLLENDEILKQDFSKINFLVRIEK